MASDEKLVEIRFFHTFQLTETTARDSDALTQARKLCDVTTTYVTTPVSVVGVALNGLVLWVWWGCKHYHASQFLLKMNAAFSAVHLVFFNTWFYLDTRKYQLIFQMLTAGCRGSQVQLTMLLMVCRFTSTFYPWFWQRRVSRSKLRGLVAVVLVLLWLLTAMDYVLWGRLPLSCWRALHAAVDILVLVLPVVLQVGVVTALVSNMAKVDLMLELSQSVNLESATTLSNSGLRLTPVILSTSLLALLAYPLCELALLLLHLTAWSATSEVVLATLAGLLQALASCLCCLLYSLLSARFRRLLKGLCQCGDRGVQRTRVLGCWLPYRVASHGSWRPA